MFDPLHQPKRKVAKPTRPLLLALVILQTRLPQPIQRPEPVVPRRIRTPSVDPGISHLPLNQFHPVLTSRLLKHIPYLLQRRSLYLRMRVNLADLGERVEDVLERVRAGIVVPPLEDDAGSAAGTGVGRGEMV